jgi:hypothetical protein
VKVNAIAAMSIRVMIEVNFFIIVWF